MIECLLDTHPVLWALSDDPRLPPLWAKRIASDPTVFGVSDASLWEVAIKRSTGKIEAPDELPQVVSELGFQPVVITRRQVWSVGSLPLHHRDPFDRLLIAQAQDLDVPIVSADPAFSEYDVSVLWQEG